MKECLSAECVVFILVMVLALQTNASDMSLEPAGLGPFEDSQQISKNQRLSEIFSLNDDGTGQCRFMGVHVLDDDSAFLVNVYTKDGEWLVESLYSEAIYSKSAKNKIIRNLRKMDASRGLIIHDQLSEVLRQTSYPDPRKRDMGPFSTGGAETYVAVCDNRHFLAARTWNPKEKSTPWYVERIIVDLFSYAKGEEGSTERIEETLASLEGSK